MFTDGPTAQRRNIIIFSSATLHIEFRLFSCKVIGKRRGKKQNGGGIHNSLRLTYGDGGR